MMMRYVGLVLITASLGMAGVLAPTQETVKPYLVKHLPFDMVLDREADAGALLTSKITILPFDAREVAKIGRWLESDCAPAKIDLDAIRLVYEETKGQRYLVDSQGRAKNPQGKEYYIKPLAFLNLANLLREHVRLR